MNNYNPDAWKYDLVIAIVMAIFIFVGLHPDPFISFIHKLIG